MASDDPDAVPQIRASDQDRNDALQRLAAAASDGRLTLEEWSGRADLALAARTHKELAGVLADLQAPATVTAETVTAEAPAKLTAILASQTRKGRWLVPARLAARAVLGDCHIELQDGLLSSPVTTIHAQATLGSVTIVVPEGVEVRLYGSAILGSHSSEAGTDHLPGAPVIEVQARAVLGSVNVVKKRQAGVLRGGAGNRAEPE